MSDRQILSLQQSGTRPSGPAPSESLERLMAPESVAVVGASESGVGRMVVESFLRLGYEGQFAAVNPRYEQVLGVPCVPRLADVPFVPDAAVFSVARDRVLPLLEDAAEKGVRGAVVFAMGFGEADEEGRELEARIAEVAAAADMALLGPNCQGFVNFGQRAPLYLDTVYAYEPGRVALIAASGSVLTSLMNNTRGVRWSHGVSCGNEAVTGAADVLAYLVEQPDVTAVCVQIETIRNVDTFLAACDRALELEKTVVVCATGRTPESQAAATSHTGALALPARLLTATLERHGAVVTETMEEFLETAVALQGPKRPRGNRLGVLAPSGGHIEFFHDNVAGRGLTVADLEDATIEALRDLLPPLLHPANPLDWWGVADPATALPQLLGIVAADKNVDLVLQIDDFTCGPTGDEPRSLGALAAIRQVQDGYDKPFVVLEGIGGTPSAADVESALAEGIVVLSGFDTGLRALGHLVSRWRARADPRPPRSLPDARARWAATGHRVVAGPTALDICEAAGIEVVPRIVASGPAEAAELSATLAFPVVVKSGDEEVAHKTESGGVLLGIQNPDAVAEAATRLFSAGAGRVLVEEQVTGGVEMLIGVQSRPPLGQFIVVGLGGIWTEVLDDVQIRPVGLRQGEAEDMLRSLRAFPLLTGARGLPAVDLAQLAHAVEQLDDLALELGPMLESIDLNPVIALPDGAVAVDALFVRQHDD